ncbi:MAG: hypothetical protein IJ529_02495 [Alphaproteobacteria bacterium]|nr:hypothetical protein [Alphaproteobacteria bacterium]MBR1648500.1 hypothetical protein [Alphaproteobacteria bacterium]
MELNKFGISPEAGDGVYAPQPARTFKVDSAVTTAFGPTTALKLAGVVSNGLPVVTPITATSDVPYCIAATSLRGNSFNGGDKIKAWVSDEVVWLKASAAITQGSKVSAAVDGTIAATGEGGVVLGYAESSASAADDLVAVRITAPYAVL